MAVKAHRLPAHLSYKSALAILPPKQLRPPFDSLRHRHDRHFKRWPPHINLIYPFLDQPSLGFDEQIRHSRRPSDDPDPNSNNKTAANNSLKALEESITQDMAPSISSRIRKVLDANHFGPIDLYARRPNHFLHSKHSATVWLHPEEKPPDSHAPASVTSDSPNGNDPTAKPTCEACPRLCQLRSLLLDEFSECAGDSGGDERPFVPHLSLGQADGEDAARKLEAEVEREIWEFVHGEGKNGEAGEEEALEAGGSGWELHWKVDQICVLERVGFRGRFRVVGVVDLVDQRPVVI
ncbi:hypothetical protein FH972_022450 [Carpinus fangiana]|uniref:Uncharacterized protein n=1 Tax=Carpinus fangiana TaxID=176857 RepID=A0A5N6KSL2_9ROSI|nr:hypothetical protein FH972_022450 [Carpinus fangiana]